MGDEQIKASSFSSRSIATTRECRSESIAIGPLPLTSISQMRRELVETSCIYQIPYPETNVVWGPCPVSTSRFRLEEPNCERHLPVWRLRPTNEGATFQVSRGGELANFRQYPPVVVITGSSAGLGRAIAHAFARKRAKIGLLARNSEALDAARSACEALGGTAIALPTDVSDAQAVEAAATHVEAKFGPIDIWINDAMVSVFSTVKEMEANDYRRVTEVLYLGFVHGTLAALRRMLPRDRGTIIQIGSALSYRSIPLQSAYCACKHAINGFTDSLRCELHHDNSRSRSPLCKCPPLIRSSSTGSRTVCRT